MQAPEQKRRGRSEEGRDSLAPEQEQVKKLTGFTMGHLQALRHLQKGPKVNARIFLRVHFCPRRAICDFSPLRPDRGACFFYRKGRSRAKFCKLCLKEGSRSDGIDPEMHLLIHMHADYLFSPKGKNVCYL